MPPLPVRTVPTETAGPTEPGSHAAVADSWLQALPVALRSSTAAERLCEQYVAASASADLADRSPGDLAAVVSSHVATGARRPTGEAVVRAVDGSVSGAGDHSTTVEVVAEDMPFLVESMASALTRLGRGIQAVVHPRFAVRRDDAGTLLDLHPVEGAGVGDAVEAWIRIEVDRPSDPAARDALVADLASVLADVRAAVRDWQQMRGKALQVADELAEGGGHGVPEDAVTGAARFLRWLADDRFTFLGYAQYDATPVGGGVDLAPTPGTSLGTVREDQSGEAPRLPDQARGRVLSVTKANSRATVHRSSHHDSVTVTRFDPEGRVTGVHRFLGLLTASAYTESVRRVPVVAEKVAEVLRRAGLAPGSHSARDLVSILEFFPRDELLQADTEEILPTALAVLHLQERRRTRLFVRHDAAGGFLSCLVFLPKDRYSTTVGSKVEELLRQALDGATAETALHVSESALARLHTVVRPRPGESLRDVDLEELEAAVAQAVRSWEDDVLDAARARLGAAEGTALVRRWMGGVPGAYRADVPAARAVEDLQRADALLAATGSRPPEDGEVPEPPVEPAPVLALRDADGQPLTWRLSLYRSSPATLSEVLPVLTDLGVEVTDERPHLLQRTDGRSVWVYDVGLRPPRELAFRDDDAEQIHARFCDAFAAAWAGRAESDALSRLVLAAQLTWQQVAVVRALVRYLRQTGLPYSLDYLAGTLLGDVAATCLIVRLFEARFDPQHNQAPGERERATRAALAEVNSAIEAVVSRDADRILRALLSTVRAVLRTNAFRRGTDGAPPQHLSFKVDPAQVTGMPEPKPAYEIWVYSPRVEGVHLRFGDAARGGLRWSDRQEDFRTEILSLVKAQIVKNAVIVPTGAKGGFVGKRLPDPAVDRDAWWAEGIACYRTFISGLLDVTDDVRGDGNRQVVVPPADVVRYDGDDPYLVVAADKGTATFSDIANGIAQERNFWLGDAFASGGSNGYDHKAMGITARGAWESVRRHFRELGVDPQAEDITVVGVGDMSGDVFGNGMLLSKHIRLVAAFDHRHVFLDPDPDPETSFRERVRLFALPRSSWADYDPALLSPGGGVHPRSAKSVPVTPQVAARLGLPEGTRSLAPDELLRAVLRAPVDLFWNGGIGTYVKASTETHGQVGDKANDAVRLDGADLRVRVVGEGGNLGLTQRGRVQAAQQGVKLNTDAIDNSAGVDCSDHEVNIKILLDGLVTDGLLQRDERNRTLQQMTDDVARLVLRNNYEQNRVLSGEGVGSADMLPAHRRLLEALEAAGEIDRGLEALPPTAELDRRAREGAGLTMPELSVLLSYAKISLGNAVLASGLPDEDWSRAALRAYFPVRLGERFPDRVTQHPLRREIVTTVLVNEVVASGGLAFAFRAAEETGSDLAEVVRAHAVVTGVFRLDERSSAVEALDGLVPASVQTLMRHQHQRLLDRAVRWFLHARPEGIDVPREIDRFAPAIRALAARVPDMLLGHDRDYVRDLADRFTGAGVDAAEALSTADLLSVYPLLHVVEVAAETGRPAAEVAPVWFVLSERYGFDLLNAVSALSREDRWAAQARAALRDDLYAVLREFTAAVLGHDRTAPTFDAEQEPTSAVVAWEENHAAVVERARHTLAAFEESGRRDVVALSVALRTLRNVLRRG